MELQEGQPVQPQPNPAPQPEGQPPPASPRQIGNFAPHPADTENEPETPPEPGQPTETPHVEQPPLSDPDAESLNDPIEDPEPNPVPEREANPMPPAFSWEASEYIFHPKSASWYFLVVLGALALGAAAVFLQQYTAAGVVAVMALAVIVIGRKQPRTLQYSLDETGITVGGKHSDYGAFKSYGVFEDVGWHTIDLEPSRRLVPNLTIICETDTFETIESILAQHLPRHDRKPDWVERLSRYLHF